MVKIKLAILGKKLKAIIKTNIVVKKLPSKGNLKGRKVFKIFSPSRGAIGIRLKSANIILTNTINPRAEIQKGGSSINLIAKASIMAIKKLEAGPAIATLASPYFWSLKL